MRPGRRTDRLHDGVDPLGQPRPGRERLVGAEAHRGCLLGLGASGRPYPVAARSRQRYACRRDTAGRALHQYGLPRPQR